MDPLRLALLILVVACLVPAGAIALSRWPKPIRWLAALVERHLVVVFCLGALGCVWDATQSFQRNEYGFVVGELLIAAWFAECAWSAQRSRTVEDPKAAA